MRDFYVRYEVMDNEILFSPMGVYAFIILLILWLAWAIWMVYLLSLEDEIDKDDDELSELRERFRRESLWKVYW